MKIGIIGGVSPYAYASFYMKLCDEYRNKYQKYPRILSYSVEVSESQEIEFFTNDLSSETLEHLSDIGNRTYLYASSYLVCLEITITEDLVSKLAKLDPLPIKFIFRDSAFKDDISLKDETFRKLKALIEKNAGASKPTYTVEFI